MAFASRDDGPEYLALARGLVQRGEFSDPYGPELHRTPGYPVFVALGVLCGAPVEVTLGLQALLGTLTVLLVQRLAFELTQKRNAALLAGWAAALEPVFLLWGVRVMAETLLTFLICLTALAALHYVRTGRLVWLLAAALGGTTAAYVKPIAQFLPVLVVAVACWRPALRTRSRRVAHGALAMLLAAVVLLPWVVRNGRVASYWAFSSKVDRMLSFAAPAAIQAERQGRTMGVVRQEFFDRYEQGRKRDGPFYRDARGRGLGEMRTGGPAYLRIYVRGVIRTLLSPAGLQFLELFGHDSASTSGLLHGFRFAEAFTRDPLGASFSAASLLMLACTLGLCALGAIRERGPASLVLTSLILYLLLLSGGPWGQSRFRHPMLPMMFALAAAGCARVRGGWAPTRHGGGVASRLPGPTGNAATRGQLPLTE